MRSELRTRRDAAAAAEILRWPADADRREELRRHGRARLLVLDPGRLPPACADDDEDWIWTPIDERDLFARLQRLTARARPRGLEPGDVVVSADGDVVVGARHLSVPPAEAAILRLLADPPGRLRPRAELEEAVWADRPRGHRAFDSRLYTLRARLVPIGLAIHTIRGRGYLLGCAPTQEIP